MSNFEGHYGPASNDLQRSGNGQEFATERPEIRQNETATAYIQWEHLVQRIQTGQSDGMEELYRLFSASVRFYLCRQTGPQHLEDRLHDLFIQIIQSIRHGEIREPQRLMGFVRTVAQRQISAHIRRAVNTRRDIDIESDCKISITGRTPEQAAIFHQREELASGVLAELSARDREVLIRFYLKEQDAAQICVEMELSDTQFRLLKSRAKARFGKLGKTKLNSKILNGAKLRIVPVRQM